MGKLSGKSGRIKLGTSTAITGATSTNGVTKISFAAAHGFVVGQFILVKGVTGMTDLNNGGKGFLISAVANTAGGTPDYSVSVALTTTQTWISGGTVQRIIPITDWSMDGSIEAGDSTDSESGAFKDKIVAGHKEWKGSYSGLDYDGAGLPPWGDVMAAEFDIDGNNYYSGTAIFTGFKTDVKVVGASAVTMNGTFEGTGELTKVKAA